ncbi:MAG: murein biosynthesis integral membrane protein MurJ [Gammaproteobacteria bacterium]|nr:murein biosynthesis integral membrane protein MurJ [Gammaproteobacteria bacterium]MBU1731361.1 murein biosynthesis integral membrane protein MurJ [Gammaproteobacteria bacterium]MBU1892866.1 murein biosynthesis integral membrane protein MurJ [Gammaproteobacteria bacterium]
MNLLKALATVGGMTLISRILGFLRDAIIARAFGAGIATDAFFVAFKLPNLLRRLFAEGAFSQAFVPILAEYKTRRGHDATRDLVDHVATLLALILLGVSLIGMLAAPVVIYISAPGFSATPEKFDLTVQLLRYIFPYIFFISLVSLAGGILNTYSRFSVPAFTPALLNLSFIGCALWLAPHMNPPVLALAVAVLLGGVLQLGFQLPFLVKVGLLPRFRLNLKDEGVWRILKLMGPAVFGVSIAQISLLINTIFASFLVTGSVSWLYYADRLMEFPTGMLGVALGTILLPSLAKHYSDDSPEQFSSLLDWGLRLTLMLALPAALALAMLAVPLISTLFYYGKFSAHDLWMTREALVAYSAGLVGLIMVKVLAPGFYARQNIRTPVKIAIFTLFATQLMNLAFVWKLQHTGLALAIGLGACINASLLYYQLRRHQIFQPQSGWLVFLLKLGVALTVMGATLWYVMGPQAAWLTGDILDRALHLSWVVIVGAGAYFAALGLLGFRPRDYIRRAA